MREIIGIFWAVRERVVFPKPTPWAHSQDPFPVRFPVPTEICVVRFSAPPVSSPLASPVPPVSYCRPCAARAACIVTAGCAHHSAAFRGLAVAAMVPVAHHRRICLNCFHIRSLCTISPCLRLECRSRGLGGLLANPGKRLVPYLLPAPVRFPVPTEICAGMTAGSFLPLSQRQLDHALRSYTTPRPSGIIGIISGCARTGAVYRMIPGTVYRMISERRRTNRPLFMRTRSMFMRIS